MKTIGLVTIIDYSNYGNRLQNFATQEVLRDLGFEVHTIINRPPSKSFFDRVRSFRKINIEDQLLIIRRKLVSKVFRQSSSALTQEQELIRNRRIQNFENFSSKYISETKIKVSNDDVPEKLGDQFDYFVAGSDQIWNPNFRRGQSFDFLTFADKEKRIAFAASFGIDDLPKKYERNYRDWLLEFAHISVREDSGADIIKCLTGQDVEVLVDPTMLLDKRAWRSISIPSETKPSKPFLITYFLGEISSEVEERICYIAKDNNLDSISLNDFRDPARYTISPNEFLDYIDSAEIVFTDSFHGAVFSLLFERPLVVCDRISDHEPMNSRINTLLSKFDVRYCKFSNQTDDYFDIDYSHIEPILIAEREKSISYLKKALNMTAIADTFDHISRC